MKSWLTVNIQKIKIMASGPIMSWQIGGETMTDFIFQCSKITADGVCSHEIKRHLTVRVCDGLGGLACCSSWGCKESDTTEQLNWTELNRTPWKESYHQPKEQIKKQRHYFVNKDPFHQGDGSSSSHEWMWGLDYKGSWEEKNWCFWTVVLGKTLESPLDCKEIQPVHPT